VKVLPWPGLVDLGQLAAALLDLALEAVAQLFGRVEITRVEVPAAPAGEGWRVRVGKGPPLRLPGPATVRA
jgi:hypothetical protein